MYICRWWQAYRRFGACEETVEGEGRSDVWQVFVCNQSALDIFGGSQVQFMDCVKWNETNNV